MDLPLNVLPAKTDGRFPGLAIGTSYAAGAGPAIQPKSPIDGAVTAEVGTASPDDVGKALEAAQQAFLKWRAVPAPRRGELVRRIGNLVRENIDDLAKLVTLEAGKIPAEAQGEIQEWVDVCDFAVGLSRQLYGLTIASERPEHELVENWRPLGPVGVISAFNFPAAVWAWNGMVGLVCGDPIVWKPSEQTPLISLACHEMVLRAAASMDDVPADVSSVVLGAADAGQALAEDPRAKLVSATGSIPMGRKVAQTVGARLGRCLLELGGNNGMIVTPSADMEMAVRAIVFSAVGTCGQRCTSLRRLIVHKNIANAMAERLKKTYATLPIGDPTKEGVLVGPLVGEAAYKQMRDSIAQAKDQGGELLCGGDRLESGAPEGGFYVEPAIVRMPAQTEVVLTETFAPLLYLLEYETFDEAIDLHNGVPQGLSSAIFTGDMREAMRFIGPAGSDCGLANVNVGTSGAEIGGAFGGEKETGGGRESGSDSWKQYMRRTTSTINHGAELPLAQGIVFGE
ncbi:Succinate-semialdehyde dehydrogenase [NADP(+)] GabD [Pseudobythopirellula maris]|uniref:Succinate-semialdehyde dehydrogenase [NADP(+)] GabD n=1 Tax=Pseudobythopirellula maris TaxID=2527991 RepID=A0A5C5ZLD0_9BACT|nr:aldehyde dehydrogenase family protein [Pseudobythopirellula maris]TWT87243.1 Succinate-semialdehyde dehydrogenase [NADP(+)] GabD [Pseudobythopirellula maris]